MTILRRLGRAVVALLRIAVTVAMVIAAILLLQAMWHRYMLSPWTRDGRVRAEIVTIAPEVSGTVTMLRLQDDQYVRKGDPLFTIDPQRFDIALAEARAAVSEAAADLALKQSDVRRRQGLSGIVSSADQERFSGVAQIAAAKLAEAQQSLNLAQLNRDRTTIYAPVDGFVANLRLRAGNYVTAGQPSLVLIDAASFWVSGYFEETKLQHIRVGDTARLKLLGYDTIITGHVTSIAHGIADTNTAAGALGLQEVNPVFTWVRLAQRIPVRIDLDPLPAGITLATGMTCSITIGRDAADHPNFWDRAAAWIASKV